MLSGVITILLLSGIKSSYATNHYVLKEDGIIKPRLDSPFHLREPDNVIKFLDQIQYNDQAEDSFKHLEKYRNELDDHIAMTALLMQQIMEKSKCTRFYVNMKGAGDYVRCTGASLKRLRFPEKMDIQEHNGVPICTEYSNNTESSFVDDIWTKLKSFNTAEMEKMKIESEEHILIFELGNKDAANVTETVRSIALKGLLNKPKVWKFHMMASYYWRLVGHAKNALECARLALVLVTKEQQDIALLNLGIVLVRSQQWEDAETVFRAAINKGPNYAENYLALATLLVLKLNFKSAREYFQLVEKLDSVMYENSSHTLKHMDCFENLENEAKKLFGYMKHMINEVQEVNKLHSEIKDIQNKIIDQQVPLASRYVNNDVYLKADLLKRYQYCSSRQLVHKKESVLYCDFYSDLQMQLESKIFNVELLEWQVNHYKSRLFERTPQEYHARLELLYQQAIAVLPTNLNDFIM